MGILRGQSLAIAYPGTTLRQPLSGKDVCLHTQPMLVSVVGTMARTHWAHTQPVVVTEDQLRIAPRSLNGFDGVFSSESAHKQCQLTIGCHLDGYPINLFENNNWSTLQKIRHSLVDRHALRVGRFPKQCAKIPKRFVGWSPLE
jgi:hypothetical protein